MPAIPIRWRMALDREMRRWHWISAAVCLSAVLLFSVTGITLNRSTWIGAEPEVTTREAVVPAGLRSLLGSSPDEAGPLPPRLAEWIGDATGAAVGDVAAEWSDEEIYLSMPTPGADAWIEIDRGSGALRYERTDRGWVAFFNDVHKGRHTGAIWRAFIDVVAIACIVFSLTGLVLLQLAARRRKSTWPLVGSGAVLVSVLLVFFLH